MIQSNPFEAIFSMTTVTDVGDCNNKHESSRILEIGKNDFGEVNRL